MSVSFAGEQTNLKVRTFQGSRSPAAERLQLVAGPLTTVLEAGQLRDIRWHGIEVLRGIAWLVRDSAWRTLMPDLKPPTLTASDNSFPVQYRGRCADQAGRFAVEASIDGHEDGTLVFSVLARVEDDLTTNRTGFVVLHPDTVAGFPLQILHADGSTEQKVFPKRIMADQPAFEIAALTHWDRGIAAEVSFDGGIFEMEDQRNWLDASFKTYVRPLRMPKPYVLKAGDVDRQTVTLRLTGIPVAAQTPPSGNPALPVSTMPHLWLRAWPGSRLPTEAPPDLAKGLIARVDLSSPDSQDLGDVAAFAARHGWAFGVEALFPLRDPEADAAALMRQFADLPVARLLVAGLRDLKSRPSASLPDDEVPLADAVTALRAAGFAGLIGAGTPAFFTEFNRNPPPPSDFMWFGGAAIVHAADDVSVFETAGVLPMVLDSAKALVPDTAVFPGPLTLAPAVSPYAPSLAENRANRRICMANQDPRHRAAFGAAYLAAVMARLIGRVEAAAPLYLNGPSGCINLEGSLWPVGALHRALASQAGKRHLTTEWHGPAFRLVWEDAGGSGKLRCNTTADVVAVPMAWIDRPMEPFEIILGLG